MRDKFVRDGAQRGGQWEDSVFTGAFVWTCESHLKMLKVIMNRSCTTS